MKTGLLNESWFIAGVTSFVAPATPIGWTINVSLKLASIIVHEAWHYRHGPREAGAYDRQIAFLTAHRGSSAQITGVRLARTRVLAAQHAIALRQDLTRTLDGELRRP